MNDETRAFYPVDNDETTIMQPLGDPDIDFAPPQETDNRAGLLDRLGLPRPQWSLPHIDTPRWLWQPTWRRRWLRWLAVLAALYLVSVLLHNAAAGYMAVAAIALWLAAWFRGRRYEVRVPPRSAVTVVFDQKTGRGRFADLDDALEAGEDHLRREWQGFPHGLLHSVADPTSGNWRRGGASVRAVAVPPR